MRAKYRRLLSPFVAFLLTALVVDALGASAGTVGGEMMRWHKVTVSFEGPSTSELADPNPFLWYRLNVTFSNDMSSFIVPGYYAGDGNGGASGNVWQANFAPAHTGAWSYCASFREGSNVNVSLVNTDGVPVSFDGATGNFVILDSDKSGRDFRSPDKGFLVNTGGHYLVFSGSGKSWIMGGPDIPENFLGYTGFDNTTNAAHSFSVHINDWQIGDPDWNGGAGKGIIGALNFLANRGVNCIYFLPMNIGGDGEDTFPTIGEQIKTRYDISKLEQWDIVFAHAMARGIYLRVQLAETEPENENYHDNGTLGPERKLYYRELLARFGHHPGAQFDLGEENDYGNAKRIQFAAHLKALDPYDHPVTTHTHTDSLNSFYGALLGNDNFDITSFQLTPSSGSLGDIVESWRAQSAQSGVPWVIGIAEPQTIENDPTDEVQGYPHGRRNKMWPVYMSGGGGFAWYVQEDGGGHTFDQRIDDFHEMDVALDWTGNALRFMDMLPVQDMMSNRSLVSSVGGGVTYALASTGNIYAVYNDLSGGPYDLDLAAESGSFVVKWFDPRNGGDLQNGSITNVSGGSWVSMGETPNNLSNDWAALVVRSDIDMDGDQMRDIWEIEFIGGTKFSSGTPSEDWDGDGASDLDEHNAGTNPADSNSVLRIQQLMPDASDTLVVHWSSESSRKYSILRRTNVLDTWVVHGSNLLGTPPMNVHTVQPTSLNGYYRVRVE